MATRDTTADRLLRWILLGAAVPGVPLGATMAIDLIIVLVALCVMGTCREIHRTEWILAAAAYLGVKATALVLGAHPATWTDFVQAYKAFLFLPVIAFFIGRSAFTREGLARTVKILLPVFAVTYLISPFPRPILWLENNFELMLLLGFFYLAFPVLGRRATAWTVLLVAVVFLSASRSSLMELGVVLLACYWRPRSRWFLAYVVGIGLAGWYGFGILAARTTGGLAKTDRSNFWRVFRADASHWGWSDWVFGTPPLTPMSARACESLSFYQGLFSEGPYGLCYSVVLHSFNLRVLYDQGIVGVIFLAVFLWSALGRSGIGTRDRVVLLGIGVVNAFSVSAFNNEFLVIVLIVAVALRPTAQEVILPETALAAPTEDEAHPSPVGSSTSSSTRYSRL